jgi:hypothetical protein
MNEMQLVLLGLVGLGISVIFFYLTDIVPAKIENTELSIIISLGIGVLILVIDKRQNRYLDEIIQTQHKMTNEIHKMIKEELTIIKDTQRRRERLVSTAIAVITWSFRLHITNLAHSISQHQFNQWELLLLHGLWNKA